MFPSLLAFRPRCIGVRTGTGLGALVAALALAPAARAETAPPAAPVVAALTLAEAEAVALARQPSVAQAHGQAEAAERRVEQARAGYLPQVTLNGTYQRTTGNFSPRPGALPTNPMAGGWTDTTYNYFNL